MTSNANPPHHSLHAKAHQFRSMINKEGKIHIHGTRAFQNPFADLYHFFLSLSWPNFFILIACIYLALNFFFGSLYFFEGLDVLGNGSSRGWERFSHCLYFSIMNMSAVDFTKAGNVGASAYLLMTIQAFLGLLTIAIMTGLFFARFSRSTARVIFSNKMIIAKHNGKPCLFFRIANERLNQIAEAHITLHITKNEISLEGEHMRKFYDLKLEREHSPLFSLSWTVRHFIDEHSPLLNMDETKMREAETGFLASLSGTDETFSQPIIARHAYSMEDIVHDKRFKDIILVHDKKLHVNLRAIHDLHEPQLAGVA
jgi:inward rectifier potassium channel